MIPNPMNPTLLILECPFYLYRKQVSGLFGSAWFATTVRRLPALPVIR